MRVNRTSRPFADKAAALTFVSKPIPFAEKADTVLFGKFAEDAGNHPHSPIRQPLTVASEGGFVLTIDPRCLCQKMQVHATILFIGSSMCICIYVFE